MSNPTFGGPMPFPAESHFATDFQKKVVHGADGQPWPKHSRGLSDNVAFVQNVTRSQGDELQPILFHYLVPDGSDPRFPVPIAGDRIYVARWNPNTVFAGGWGFSSGLAGLSDLKGEYVDPSGTVQTIVFAADLSLSPSTDFTKFELEAVYETHPSQYSIDLFFELSTAASPGDTVKGRLDFVS